MIELGQHAVFIVWAYIGVFAGVAGLIGWAAFDRSRVGRRLRELGNGRS